MRLVKGVFIFLFLSIMAGAAILGFGYMDEKYGLFTDSISVSGTGSMYPTFPKGEGTDTATLSREKVITVQMRRFPGGINLFGLRIFYNSLHIGDIISFENSQTDKLAQNETGESAGFIKRIVAVAGDKLEIRDGFVYINDQIKTESYTASARSTFGGQFLSDCKSLTIPDGFVFVMGDNRKGSSDSRHDIGLVSVNDIDHVLFFPDQKSFSTHWRDASSDIRQSLKPVLDKQDFLNLLNAKRRENKLSPLKYQPKLEISAGIRADVMLKYDDLSFSASRSGVTMANAMSSAGYSNIVWGEAPTLGYYSADELLENFFAFPSTAKFLLNPEFQETGIAAKIGMLHGCPVQIVVQHFAGYKPPNYPSDVISSWQNGLDNLQKALPGWQKLKTYSDFYNSHRSEIDELLNIYNTRISRFQSIVQQMKSNLWLTEQQNTWVKEDESLSKRLSELSTRLNSY